MFLQGVWWMAAIYNIYLWVIHIPGKQNILTDALSRDTFENNGDYIWEEVPQCVLHISL